MSALTDYQTFLRGLQLRHFSPGEVTNYARRTRGGVRNSLPPRSMWKNLVPTLWVLDQLRHETGVRINLSSIFRSPAYNAKCPGASPNSYHMRNQAIDFQSPGMSPQRLYNWLDRMRKAGTFKGGLGVYPTFVHVDTRGVNRSW